MPELPEVETVCKGLSNQILKLVIRRVIIFNRNLRYSIPLNSQKKILGKEIKSIIRRGKYGFIILNSEEIILFIQEKDIKLL